ncbi:GGDEF domain-containing protein [Treponema sp. JC4]|uniref:diguanylate cyclase domain-containing protein n=1 Tax=Treponema sp. JC4 TaxID=1124982 RepID=UPI00025AFB84|nr:diguanylate cyclase [Treponema sp. JC4]EID85817.1 GGDEF domain-containing protein [Treponema sp. JC4]
MKKSAFSLGAITVGLAFILSTVFSFFLMEHPDEKDREFSLMLAGRVNDVVTDEILRPLLVSRTMSNDNLLADWLQHEEEHSLGENAISMQNYLSRLKEEFGYTSAFLISEKSHCYYTYRGFNKIINPLNDPHDKWYPTFLKKNIAFELNADTDQVNGNHWTIFINCRITAPDGTLLGVCGVGVIMDHLRQIMEEYEKQYGVKINLVDSNGLVQMAVDYSDIQRIYLNNIELNKSDDNYSVRQSMRKYRISKYLKELGWYLVVQTGGHASASKFIPFFILNIISAIILIVLYYLIIYLKEKNGSEKNSDPNPLDEVTELPNRIYFTEAYGENGIFNTTRYKCFIVFDIDHFSAEQKKRPDLPLIKLTADIAKRHFDMSGLLLRWRSDTFVVLSEKEIGASMDLCRNFCSQVLEELGITISAGLAQIVLTDSIKKNYYAAMQGCYAAKFAGGNKAVIHQGESL